MLGRGWIASGPPVASRQPLPVWPQGLRTLPREAAGEVQTPLQGGAAARLGVGDRVWFRHAKSGEPAERIDRYHLVSGDEDHRRTAHVPRRGEGVPVTRIGGTWQNWGRSVQVTPLRVERPRTPEGVQRAVMAAAARGLPIKAVGAGHSFTGIAVAPGVLLELDDMQGLVSADAASGRVTLLAGTRLHRIPALLAPYGLAMENLGDIDSQSIAGAISTGTHGTGARFGGVATQVVGVTLVTAAGELRTDDADRTPSSCPPSPSVSAHSASSSR